MLKRVLFGILGGLFFGFALGVWLLPDFIALLFPSIADTTMGLIALIGLLLFGIGGFILSFKNSKTFEKFFIALIKGRANYQTIGLNRQKIDDIDFNKNVLRSSADNKTEKL